MSGDEDFDARVEEGEGMTIAELVAELRSPSDHPDDISVLCEVAARRIEALEGCTITLTHAPGVETEERVCQCVDIDGNPVTETLLVPITRPPPWPGLPPGREKP